MTGVTGWLRSLRPAGGGRVLRQRLAVHSDGRQAEVAQNRRGNIDQRRTAVIGARGKSAAGGEQERALLVFTEAAMLAKSGAVLRFECVADDVAVAGDAM